MALPRPGTESPVRPKARRRILHPD